MSDTEVRLMIATRMADALNRLSRAADDLAHDDELNFGDLAQALSEALELAGTAVRQLDRELRDKRRARRRAVAAAGAPAQRAGLDG